MKPEDHFLLSQLVHLGLQKLTEQASAALNGVTVDQPEPAPEAAPEAQPQEEQPHG